MPRPYTETGTYSGFIIKFLDGRVEYIPMFTMIRGISKFIMFNPESIRASVILGLCEIVVSDYNIFHGSLPEDTVACYEDMFYFYSKYIYMSKGRF